MNTTWAILWDMDGVLVDTTEAHYKAWLDILSAYGIEYSRKQFLDEFGMNNFSILSQLFNTADLEVITPLSERKEQLFRDYARGHLKLLPGTAHWLKQFRQWKFPQAICSSAPQKNIDAIIETTDINTYFTIQLSAANLRGKPDPEVFLKAADLLGVSPERCLVVEDATVGVQAAKSAGMKCIAVETTRSAKELDQADLVIPDLSHLDDQRLRTILNNHIRD